MNLEPGTIMQLATLHGAQPTTLEKVLRLNEVLQAVSVHPYLGSRLALKGGTALNLFFGAPKRLSVDLDFNYVGQVGRTEMLSERPEVERAIDSIGAALGYVAQTNPDAHAGRKWFFTYTNHENRRDRIEVDVVYTNRVPLRRLQSLTPWTPDGSQSKPTLVCSVEELVAGKVRALLDRVAARDVFDVTWVTGLIVSQEWPLFKKLFVFFSGTLDRPLHSYSVDLIDRVSEMDIDNQLKPMLMQKAELSRATLVEAAKSAVAPLLELEDEEVEFCDALNRGEFMPSLLLRAWPEILSELESHPALLWKAQNAKTGSDRLRP